MSASTGTRSASPEPAIRRRQSRPKTEGPRPVAEEATPKPAPAQPPKPSPKHRRLKPEIQILLSGRIRSPGRLEMGRPDGPAPSRGREGTPGDRGPERLPVRAGRPSCWARPGRGSQRRSRSATRGRIGPAPGPPTRKPQPSATRGAGAPGRPEQGGGGGERERKKKKKRGAPHFDSRPQPAAGAGTKGILRLAEGLCSAAPRPPRPPRRAKTAPATSFGDGHRHRRRHRGGRGHGGPSQGYRGGRPQEGDRSRLAGENEHRGGDRQGGTPAPAPPQRPRPRPGRRAPPGGPAQGGGSDPVAVKLAKALANERILPRRPASSGRLFLFPWPISSSTAAYPRRDPSPRRATRIPCCRSCAPRSLADGPVALTNVPDITDLDKLVAFFQEQGSPPRWDRAAGSTRGRPQQFPPLRS